LAFLEQEAALLRRPFPKFTDGILHHPLGASFVDTSGNVPSLLALRLNPEVAIQKARDQVVLISGAGGNHTSFGEIPRRLSEENWQVRMLVYPGYQNPSDPRPLAGGGLKSHRVAKLWQESMRQSVRDIVEKHDGEQALILGGFSMGAAGVLDAYHSLPHPLRAKVDGLILAAPAIYPRALDGPNPIVNFIARRLALPGMALLGMNLKKKESGLHPSAEGLVDTAMQVPRGANHAAVLTIERGRRAAERLAKEGGIPETLLIHAGNHDPTISARSTAQLKTWFGKSISSENEIQVPREDGHYVLVGSRRQLVTEKIHAFANGKALKKSGERLEEAMRKMDAEYLRLRARRLGHN
jgi:alpha-beta hydrolase superfamily lysophospholipase